jgi:hypothetical protein
VSSRPDAHLSIVPSVRKTCHTFRTPDRPSIIHPDDVDFRPSPPLYREASVPSCIHPDVSAARPNASQYSIKLQILSKFKYGKIAATVRTTWIPVRTRFSLRQELQFKYKLSGRQSAWSGRAFNIYGNCVFNFNRSDACLSWSGRALNRFGNCVLKINHPDDQPPWSGRAKPYMGINYSGRATVRPTVPHRPDAALKQERFSAKISEILVAQLSVQTIHVHRPDGVRIFHSSRPFEPQPINKGLWALRTARIRH